VTAPLLEVDDLAVEFATDDQRRVVRAVAGVSFGVGAGETVALVGESGSGKTVTALAIMGLVGGRGRVAGDVRVDGTSVLGLDDESARRLRGREVAMVFQDPLSALNPVRRVGDQIAEAVLVHGGGDRRAAAARAVETLESLGVADAT